jgi:hypothetical protein
MPSLRYTAAVLAAGFVSLASAREPSHYRVEEVPSPDFAGAEACLPGYAKQLIIDGMNDSGVVAGTFQCTTAVEPNLSSIYRAFISAPSFGSYALPVALAGDNSSAVNIDRRSTVYGANLGSSTRGAAWPLGGGVDIALQPFEGCGGNGFGLDWVNSGNPRGYVVGWTFRTDPSLPPPLDTICLSIGWAWRTPAGNTAYGPASGVATDVNAHDVAVGRDGRAAVRLDLATGVETVLNPADDTHSAQATDINDRGEVAGWIDDFPPGTATSQCGPSTPKLWEKNGRERALRLLPGDSSGRAWAAGYDDEVVGESGPGGYCDSSYWFNQTAVLWIEKRAYDLNALIPRGKGLTLLYAVDVNRAGQIAVAGYRNEDPLLPCPGYTTDPVTGAAVLDKTLLCRPLRAYVLTPR